MSNLVIQGALELGLLYAIMSFGVYISFRILNIPDLTIDGSFVSGCAISAVCSVNGHPFIGILLAFLIGGLAGACTGVLQTKCKIQPLLAGILIMTGLYSLNYRIMGNMPNINVFGSDLIFDPINNILQTGLGKLITILIILSICMIILYYFLKTQLGMCLRATGDNEAMVRASSINSDGMKIFGLFLANAIVAFGGGILTQYQGFADLNDGVGKMVIGLASIIVGEAIFTHKTLLRSFLSVVVGSILYRFILTIALQFGVGASDQKLLSSLLVIIAISFPIIKSKYLKRRKRHA